MVFLSSQACIIGGRTTEEWAHQTVAWWDTKQSHNDYLPTTI